MPITLEFVGGPMDGETRTFGYRPNEWRFPLPERRNTFAEPTDMLHCTPLRYGVYRHATFRKCQRVTGRTYLVDVDVLRWMGE